MRWILPVGCFLVLTVIMCGCIQSPSAGSGSPSPTGGISVVMLTDTTVPQHPRMEVNVTAEETKNSVIVHVIGGKDAAALTSLNIRITNHDGTNIQRTVPSPGAGKSYSIMYYRLANAAKVNIVGTFSDGFQQTLLITDV